MMKTTTQGSDLEEKRIGVDLRTNDHDLTKYSKAVEPLIRTTLKVHPACLEFAPANISDDHPASLRTEAWEYFVVGTYQLAEELEVNGQKIPSCDKHQERIGGLSLFRFQKLGAELYWVQDIFREYGVYDIKFLPFHPVFAAATTVGRIVIFQFEENNSKDKNPRLQIKEISSHLVFHEEIIIISIAWFPLQDQGDKTRVLAVTVENGGVYLLGFDDSFKSFEILNNELPLHEHVYKTPFFENKERVWSCAFSSPVPDRAFSGGDDNYFRSSKLILNPPGIQNIQKCNSTDELVSLDDQENAREKFPAGVTSILPLPIVDSVNSQILLIGSYDNHIRLCRMIKHTSAAPEFSYLVDLDLGGGVYRLKFLELYPIIQEKQEASFKILACCMHAGAKILQVSRNMDSWSIDILAEVKDNESMCYAADVQPLPISIGSQDQDRICVSSSWADSKLSIWKFSPKII